MDAAQFDKALRSYASNGRYRYYRFDSAALRPTITRETLSVTDGGAVLADIHLHSRDYHEQAVTEFQEILKSDPTTPRVSRPWLRLFATPGVPRSRRVF